MLLQEVDSNQAKIKALQAGFEKVNSTDMIDRMSLSSHEERADLHVAKCMFPSPHD